MSDCTHTTTLGHLPDRLNGFGQLAPRHNSRPRLRFLDGDGGDGAGDGGDGGDGDGGDGDEKKSEKLGAAGVQAFERTKTSLRATKADLKAFKDLGLTPDEIKALIDGKPKDEAGKGGDAPDEAAIEKRIRQQLEGDAREKAATRFRASNVREQAATMGFIDPKEALALLNSKDLAEVDVDDDDEVDEIAVKSLLEDLAKKKPHLLKPTDETPDARAAGIGSTGSAAKAEVQPGADRLRHAYAKNDKKK